MSRQNIQVPELGPSIPDLLFEDNKTYKTVALVRGTNIVRKEIGAPEAECLAADPKYSLIRSS